MPLHVNFWSLQLLIRNHEMHAQVLSQSYQARTLPGRNDFTANMFWTSAAVVLLPNLLAILARKKSRKLLLDTLESILAVILVIILLGIVLGLPVGESLHTCPVQRQSSITRRLQACLIHEHSIYVMPRSAPVASIL